MKTLLLSLLLASSVPAPTVDAAITQTYVKCFANHWKGTETTQIRNSDNYVLLDCGDFWKQKRKKGTPFTLFDSGVYSLVPYDVWSNALGNLMTISKEPK